MILAYQEGALWFLDILLVTTWRGFILIDGETLAALTLDKLLKGFIVNLVDLPL